MERNADRLSELNNFVAKQAVPVNTVYGLWRLTGILCNRLILESHYNNVIPYQVTTYYLLQQDNICDQKWQTGSGWQPSFGNIHKDDKVYGPIFVGTANCTCNFGHQSMSPPVTNCDSYELRSKSYRGGQSEDSHVFS